MKIGILSDTHDQESRTRRAVEVLEASGAELLVHCGDLASAEIVRICSALPFYFVFGNHDADVVPELRAAAQKHDSTCLGWGGAITVSSKRIAIAHGHMTMDIQPLLKASPDYLFSGHSHLARDWREGATRRINPGALFRASKFSVALLDIDNDDVAFLPIES